MSVNLIEVKVPQLPESVADATIAAWYKNIGDKVARYENLLDLETDKVVLEVPAPVAGILKDIITNTGDTVLSGQIIAHIEVSDAVNLVVEPIVATTAVAASVAAGPAARRVLAEHDLTVEQVPAIEGRVSKTDVLNFLDKPKANNVSAKVAVTPTVNARAERRVPMTRLRTKIAERLVKAQHDAAMLTTFNEVNLQAVMDLRAQYKDSFEKKYGVRLGFMSFVTQVIVAALKRFPAMNASLDGHDIVYHDYYDIGIAVSTERGLVVPVLRDADTMSMANIEQSIQDFAVRARQSKLALEEMQGGTFTITNGGIFGSLLSTPIINSPQVGILGMHKIIERPVVENKQIVIRPMMYLALSYDHRLIDGKESVQFLVAVKEMLEDPARILINI